jgi:hypothetical protein
MNIVIAILTVVLIYMLITNGKELIQTATMLPTTTTMLPTTTTMLPTTTTTMLPTTTTMLPTTTTTLPTTTTMLPTTTTTTMLPTTTTIIPTTTQPVSEYYNIINNPSYEQFRSYVFNYLKPQDYRVASEIFFNIDDNILPILTKNNTVIEYKTNQNSGGFGYFSSIYLKLFIDPTVLKSINYTLLKTVIISKLVFNVTFDQRFTDITGYVVFNVSSIATTTQN